MQPELTTLGSGACDDPGRAEEMARVVAVDGGRLWLQAEPAAGCSGCASAGMCKVGAGDTAPRGRFAIEDPGGLSVGDRVVVGIARDRLLLAALAAYVLPLACAMLAGAGMAGPAHDDVAAIVAVVSGLGAGLVLARLLVRHLEHDGGLVPCYLRRAGPA